MNKKVIIFNSPIYIEKKDINEDYQTQLHDIVDSLDEITDEFQKLLSADRMNRKKLNEQVRKLKSVRNKIYKEL